MMRLNHPYKYNHSFDMTLVLSFVSEVKSLTVVWYVEGKAYGPYKKGAVPANMIVKTSDRPLSVTALVNSSCNPAASIIVYPTPDPSPQVFAQGLFLSAEVTAGKTVITLSGKSNCSSSNGYPSWASPFIMIAISLITIATLVLCGMAVVFNYFKIKHLKLQLTGKLPLQPPDLGLGSTPSISNI
jgi:hypothetical protein